MRSSVRDMRLAPPSGVGGMWARFVLRIAIRTWREVSFRRMGGGRFVGARGEAAHSVGRDNGVAHLWDSREVALALARSQKGLKDFLVDVGDETSFRIRTREVV